MELGAYKFATKLSKAVTQVGPFLRAHVVDWLVQQLVTDFLAEPEPTKYPAATVVRIGGDEYA